LNTGNLKSPKENSHFVLLICNFHGNFYFKFYTQTLFTHLLLEFSKLWKTQFGNAFHDLALSYFQLSLFSFIFVSMTRFFKV